MLKWDCSIDQFTNRFKHDNNTYVRNLETVETCNCNYFTKLTSKLLNTKTTTAEAYHP